VTVDRVLDEGVFSPLLTDGGGGEGTVSVLPGLRLTPPSCSPDPNGLANLFSDPILRVRRLLVLVATDFVYGSCGVPERGGWGTLYQPSTARFSLPLVGGAGEGLGWYPGAWVGLCAASFVDAGSGGGA